jgi:hypothetical protein
MDWKGFGTKQLWPNDVLHCYLLDELTKTTKTHQSG